MVKDNTYVYLDHLLAFDICRPVEDLSWLVISPEIHSPLQASVWATELSDHPDKAYVKYILQGISNGFRIVTGYWKTDHNVTLGQLHFIGPANSHTHALSMH